MTSFDVLKKIAIETGINISKDQLEELIMKFSDEINTPRRRQCIRTIQDLIVYLQRSDALSEENISALSVIADLTGTRELQLAIANYEPLKIDMPTNMNQYALHRLGCNRNQQQNNIMPSSSISSRQDMMNKHIGITITEEKLSKVNSLISQEIGNYWRRLGRELGINEATMDELEIIYPRDLSSRTIKILLNKEKQYKDNLGQYINILCQALVACQRRDLRRTIENYLIAN